MAFVETFAILFLFLFFVSFLIFPCQAQNLKTLIHRNWRTITVLKNLHRLHELNTKKLKHSGGTFMFRAGPWFSNIHMLVTTNPLDINHILSKNFNNYPKGENFRKLFDPLGDGIINVDGLLWEFHRKSIKSVFRQPNFHNVFEAIIWNKVETGLLPVFDSFSKQGKEIDLQEMFQRFTFDTICKLLFDNDLQCLSLDGSSIPCEKAITHIQEGIFYRHFIPPIIRKLQHFLRMGNERNLSEACSIMDDYIYEFISKTESESNDQENFGLATSLMREFKGQTDSYVDPRKFIRDTIVNLIGAGKDSTSIALSWFFYLVAKNPTVEKKIREEIHTYVEVNGVHRWKSKELGKLVYLHGALCETLRLYPPFPFNHKTPLEPEILPSGHKVSQNTKIILYYYGMGRMENIWGEDCMDFKPERWILKEGGIKHEPSYKFPAFNSGPRTCLGKDMSFTQLKILASAIIYHYHIELIEGHLVLPSASMVLRMKNGLKVTLTKLREVNY